MVKLFLVKRLQIDKDLKYNTLNRGYVSLTASARWLSEGKKGFYRLNWFICKHTYKPLMFSLSNYKKSLNKGFNWL